MLTLQSDGKWPWDCALLTAVCVNPMQPMAEEGRAQDPATPELQPAGVMVELWECSRAREEVQLWENGHYMVCSLYCVIPDAHKVPESEDFLGLCLEAHSAWE